MREACTRAALANTPASVRVIRIRKTLSGRAYSPEEIAVPRPVTRRALHVFLHECAHVALGHVGGNNAAQFGPTLPHVRPGAAQAAPGPRPRRKPRHVEEYEAERWAFDRMREAGIAVPRKSLRRAKSYLAFLRERGREPSVAAREDVLAYLEHRKDDGLKSASLFIAAMAVRQFHRYLAQAGLAPADPTVGMRLPRFKQRIPKPLAPEAMDRLLRPPLGAKFSALRDHAMLELMYATGMRVSDLTGLRLGQVEFRESWVCVLGKGSKERLVPFGPRAGAALGRYLEVRAARFPAAGDVLFLNGRGRGPITRGSFGRRLGAAARRAGLSGGVTPHVLRHSAATAMLEGGASIRVIQEMLGHSSMSTTIQRYAHVSPEFLRKACQQAHPRF
ncbi:MAG: hypothetical protein CO113_12225 [Elusimicrobia bacterium CG_4_9_14_3_um_filter_62_55]|nr:MAG: hypothetical protein COX66_13075 [Elusimicrobia bacterium CG_4_10_14_0_2_um_filter_63_34]PJB24752.1 MAG: hypothetical protein CO113_12225 [Elusimicrobia bacterium CG_4_9_14_3_um_filter_62_55]